MTPEERKKAREQRAKLVDQMRAIDKKATDEDRDLSDEERKQFEDLETQAKQINDRIERSERLANFENPKEDDDPKNRSNRPGHGPLDDKTRNEPDQQPDLSQYSLMKVLRSQVEHRPLDGVEREMSDEIARRSQKAPEGVYIPHEIALEQRDLTTTTGSGAVATQTMRTFIQMLRDRTLVNQLGARMMGGLIGDLSIPKQTGGATAYWVDEGNAPTKSSQAVGQVGLAPNTVGAFSDMTRKFLRQSSFDAEAFVRADLAAVIARAIDTAVFNGSGTGAEPEGILQNTNVPTVSLGTDGAAPTFPKVVELETTVAASNADVGSQAYVTNAKGRGVLKTTPKVTNEPTYIWSDTNMVNGYNASATNLIPSNLTKGSGTNLSAMIFGNWTDVVIGMWGGLDLLVDPYTNGNAGTVRVNALQDVDIALRHPESFAKIADMVTG